MKQSRAPIAAALLAELRTPLARVALATSQIARESASPATHALVGSIAEAVSAIDAGIERVLPLLVEVEAHSEPLAPLEGVIEPLLRRLGPALRAREVSLAVDAPSFVGVQCDAHRTRRGAAALLQAGSAWLGRGGALALCVAREGEALGLRLDCTSRGAPPRREEALRDLASHCPGDVCVEHSESAEATRATLWLPRAEACDAC